MQKEHASIIMVCYRKGTYARLQSMKRSISSLLENTVYPYELILVDNTQNNRGLGAARNHGIRQATGAFVAIVDDDLLFKKNWLTACINILKRTEGNKWIASCLWTGRPWERRYEEEPVNGHRRNMRAGSNCLVMRREALNDIGLFINEHPRIDGVEFCNRQIKKGYSVLLTKEAYAEDLAFKASIYKQKAAYTKNVGAIIRRRRVRLNDTLGVRGKDLHEIYHALLQLPRDATVLEIGIANATVPALLKRIRSDIRYIGIDIKVTEEARRLLHAEEKMSWIEQPSYIALQHLGQHNKDAIDLIHIDGDHTVSGTRTDTAMCLPLLKPGGQIWWHDFDNRKTGVKEALKTLATSYPRIWAELRTAGTSYAVWRSSDNTSDSNTK